MWLCYNCLFSLCHIIMLGGLCHWVMLKHYTSRQCGLKHLQGQITWASLVRMLLFQMWSKHCLSVRWLEIGLWKRPNESLNPWVCIVHILQWILIEISWHLTFKPHTCLHWLFCSPFDNNKVGVPLRCVYLLWGDKQTERGQGSLRAFKKQGLKNHLYVCHYWLYLLFSQLIQWSEFFLCCCSKIPK